MFEDGDIPEVNPLQNHPVKLSSKKREKYGQSEGNVSSIIGDNTFSNETWKKSWGWRMKVWVFFSFPVTESRKPHWRAVHRGSKRTVFAVFIIFGYSHHTTGFMRIPIKQTEWTVKVYGHNPSVQGVVESPPYRSTIQAAYELHISTAAISPFVSTQQTSRQVTKHIWKYRFSVHIMFEYIHCPPPIRLKTTWANFQLR